METKIAVITGGSRGLGRNAALALAKKGVHSVITYQSNKAAADATVKDVEALGAKAVALQLDTAKAATFPEFAQALKAALQQTWKRDRFDDVAGEQRGHGPAPPVRRDDRGRLRRDAASRP